jgi:hypothetical protein
MQGDAESARKMARLQEGLALVELSFDGNATIRALSR